jgi:hypothetical protein
MEINETVQTVAIIVSNIMIWGAIIIGTLYLIPEVWKAHQRGLARLRAYNTLTAAHAAPSENVEETYPVTVDLRDCA